MLATRLIRLIERHAESLTQAAMHDVLTNERTRSFHQIPMETGSEIQKKTPSGKSTNIGVELGFMKEFHYRR